MKTRVMISLVAVTSCLAGLRTLGDPPHASASSLRHRNFVVIVTDDQSINMLQLMPNVRHLRADGMSFANAFVSNPLCCPSRATIFTGLLSHGTGVYTNGEGSSLAKSFGGWSAFRSKGLDGSGQRSLDNERRTAALFLHQHGYTTGLFGKYLNHYGDPGAGDVPSVPTGWSGWRSFAGRNGRYYDYWVRNQGGSRYVSRTYSTDFFGARANHWLAKRRDRPFFLYFAPFAPHGVPQPAPQDAHVRAPISFKTKAFNERNMSDKPPFMRDLPLLEASKLRHIQDLRYGTLVDVDRWIGRFVTTLKRNGQYRDTVFIFLSDNGVTMGDHRWKGKEVPYERSIGVPLIIAGPRIVHGRSTRLVLNTDLAPTILDLAGLLNGDSTYTDPRGHVHRFDGPSLRPLLRGVVSYVPHRDALAPSGQSIVLEHLSEGSVPSYCGLRTLRWKFVVYRDGFEELYDLKTDPFELHNVVHHEPGIRSRMLTALQAACAPVPPDFPPWGSVTP